MTRIGRRWWLPAVVAVALLVGACGGGGASSDPAGSVSNALAAVNGGGLTKLNEFACAAHKNDIANAFGAGNAAQLQAAGIKMDDLLNAMTVQFTNVKTSETSKTDTTAKVHVTADMAINFDREKMKAIFKTVLAAQGQPTDDTTIDTVLNAMSGQLTQTQHIDSDIAVVNEGGKWLICE
jgi:hypothetical protein